MIIDFHASAPHYLDHLEPIYGALHPRNIGTVRVGLGMEDYARSLGIEPSDREAGDVVVVASWADARQSRARRVVLMEHGIGQTYEGRRPEYAGGFGRERVALFLAPNERVLRANQEATPGSEHALVGMPLMDQWFTTAPPTTGQFFATFHWEADFTNEAMSGWRYFRDAIVEMQQVGPIFTSHHPRAPEIGQWFRAHGVPVVEDFSGVMRHGSVLAFDNTSAGFMFAATDRPVVVLNPPHYRRDVEHGLRFWEFADVGVQCFDPQELAEAFETALADPFDIADRRREITAELFPVRDGTSATRAVDAILALG